ncbi:hypothetical protein ACS0TY_027124 [Phlomoides rotata]
MDDWMKAKLILNSFHLLFISIASDTFDWNMLAVPPSGSPKFFIDVTVTETYIIFRLLLNFFEQLIISNPNNEKNKKIVLKKDQEMDIKAITELFPYEDGWTIKVRVARKTSRETYLKKDRKTETVKLILQDQEGSMVQATLFNEQIDKFYEMLESGKCYLISKGNIRHVNKKFDNVNDKIEISFTNATKVEESLECFPLKLTKPFVPFNEVENKSTDQSLMDILGMVVKVKQSFPVPLKSIAKTTRKCEVTLLDLTGDTIKLDLWGDLAMNEGEILERMESLRPLVAVSNVVLNKYEGEVNLGTSRISFVEINPVVEQFEAFQQSFQKFNSTAGVMDKISGPSKRIMESQEVSLANITGNNVQRLFCTFVGKVEKVLNRAKPWYEKCKECNTAVHPEGNMKLRIAEHGDEEVCTTLFDAAETIIGCPVNCFAEKMLTVMDQDKYTCPYYKNLVLCKGKTFKFLVKMGNKKSEDRAEKKIVVEEVLKIDPALKEKASSSHKRKIDP